jgi:hypothetical protein
MEQMNPGQIKKTLKQLRQRQEQYLYYLGQLAFQAGEGGKLTEPDMQEAYRTLKDIQAQIAQGESTLEQIKAAKEEAQNPRCPNCGGATAKNAPFCPNCGSSLVAPPPGAPVAAATVAAAAPVPAGNTCANCGASLDADAVFCGNCGAKTAAAEPQTPAQPDAQAAAPQPEATEAPAPEPAASPPQEKESEEPMPDVGETLACPGCGKGIVEVDMIFCPECGTKVRE